MDEIDINLQGTDQTPHGTVRVQTGIQWKEIYMKVCTALGGVSGWHLALPLMNIFNNTEAAIFLMQTISFLRTFPFTHLNTSTTIQYTLYIPTGCF